MRNPEILFLVEETPEGGFTAKAAGASIFTEAYSIDTLKTEILDAVRCHFEQPEDIPVNMRLHIVKAEALLYA